MFLRSLNQLNQNPIQKTIDFGMMEPEVLKC